jgi:TetR/AcrR family transcriptional regulator
VKLPPPSAPTAKGEAARAAILETAARLFARKGYRATSISEIAEQAGINRAMISYYFASKAGLYRAIIAAAVEDVRAGLDGGDFDYGASDSERSLVRAFAAMLSRRPEFPAMVVSEMIEGGAMLDDQAVTALRGFSQLTDRVLAESRLRPQARTYDPQIVHLICVGALIHFMVTRPYREAMWDRPSWTSTKPGLDQFVETLADFMTRALREG